MNLPINLPFLWKVVLNTPGEESGFIDAGNKLLNDLFYDLTSYYANLDIESCNLFKKHLTRIVTFRYYPDYDSLTPAQQAYLYDNGFVVPDDSVLGTYKAYVSGKAIAALSDSFYEPDFYIKNNLGFEVDNGVITFDFNIFDNEDGVSYNNENYVTAWGELISIRTVRLFASESTLEESPLWNNFGGLVYSREIEETETEEEYRSKIIGLFYLFYRGMTQNTLNTSLNVAFGFPVFLNNNEKILEISTTTITTDQGTYTIDSNYSLNPDLEVGRTYPKFTPIHNVITITDYETDPTWIQGKILPWYMYYNSDVSSRIVDLTTTYPFTYTGSATSRLRYDTWGVHPFWDDTTSSVRTYHYTYYVWEQFFKNTLFSIDLKLNDFNLDDIVEMEIFDSVLPIWSAYILTGELEIEDELLINEPNNPGSLEEDPVYLGASVTAGFGSSSYFADTTVKTFAPTAWTSDRELPNTFTNVGATVTSVNHGLVEGDTVKLPTGFFGGMEYLRVVAPVAANTFTVTPVPFANVGPATGYETFDSMGDYNRAVPAIAIPTFKFNAMAVDPYWHAGAGLPNWIESQRPGMLDGAHVMTSDKSLLNLADTDTATVTCMQDTTSIHGISIEASNLSAVNYVQFNAAGNFDIKIYSDRMEIDVLTGLPAPQAAYVFNYAGGPYTSGLFVINLNYTALGPSTQMQLKVASTQMWDEKDESFHAETILNAPANPVTTFYRSGGVIENIYMDGTYI